jgi:hypothetical protein
MVAPIRDDCGDSKSRERVESDTIGLSRLTLPDLFTAPQLILGSEETANRAISVPLGKSLFSSQDQRIVLVSTGGRGLENGRPDVRMSQGARKERERPDDYCGSYRQRNGFSHGVLESNRDAAKILPL